MAMFVINDTIQIPEEEFTWTFVRAGGPGGQNVNKVASKAVLRWELAQNTTIPEDARARLQQQQKGRITQEGTMLITSQRYRDQDRNRQDCLEKLRQAVQQALFVPKPRKKTKPSRSSRENRLRDKKARAQTKSLRQRPGKEW
jgi:ribosome-associated protein